MQDKDREVNQKSKALRIRIVLIIAMLAVISVTYFVITTLADSGFFIIPDTEKGPKFDFYTPDFEYDIFSDSEYLSLIQDEFISHSDGATKVNVDESEYNSYSPAAQLIFKMIHAARNGDADAYNACFSQAYKEKSGVKEKFTMQQIYDVVVVEGYTVKEGSYQRTDFELEYKIHKNNGTFRSDIDSDASKKQYITVTTNNSNEVPLIDSVTVVNLNFKGDQNPQEYNVQSVITVAVVAVAVIGVSFAGVAVGFTKTKNIRCK